MTGSSIISCRGLVPETSRFDFSGKGLDIDITAGEIVSIIGPDYTGKSGWMSTMAGIYMPREGTLTLQGKDINEFQRQDWITTRRNLAFVRSDTAILSAANARANVILPARYHRLDSAKNLIAQAVELLDELGVSDQTSLPAYLRTEQRYKIAIARALILQPAALMLDSPFQRLDAVALEKFQQFLLDRVKRYNMALVLVTHDVNFAIEHSDQVLFVTREQVHLFDKDEDIRRCDINDISSFLNKSRVSC